MKIQNINSFTELSFVLGYKTGHLRRILFDINSSSYTSFEIPKKNGEVRKIYSPHSQLLLLQKKVAAILENSFNPHYKSFGFIKRKSIEKNAKLHLKKKYLINIDLKNFFESITAGRVYSMFVNYFKLDRNIAAILTNICCHPDGFLPQGAPTSPIITNILCKTLDKELDNLSKRYSITYSRYADDITFSSNKAFNSYFLTQEELLSDDIKRKIEQNGFLINENKFRYSKFNQRKEVTGIIVNEKLNVDRRYIRKIRAMLYSIENNLDNLEVPRTKFVKSHYKGDTIEDLLNVIKGMISYTTMVKGKNNISTKLEMRFNDILECLEIDSVKPIKVKPLDINEEKVCVIKLEKVFFESKNSGFYDIDYGQGTGFILKNVGIVSNYHVFEFIIEELEKGKKPICTDKYFINLYFGINCSKKVKAKVLNYDKDKDLVILQPKDLNILELGFELEEGTIENNSKVTLLGYPSYNEGDRIKEEQGKLLRKINDKKDFEKFEISSVIHAGNSGGPVLNNKGKVLGVATEGRGNDINKVVPITNVLSM